MEKSLSLGAMLSGMFLANWVIAALSSSLSVSYSGKYLR